MRLMTWRALSMSPYLVATVALPRARRPGSPPLLIPGQLTLHKSTGVPATRPRTVWGMPWRAWEEGAARVHWYTMSKQSGEAVLSPTSSRPMGTTTSGGRLTLSEEPGKCSSAASSTRSLNPRFVRRL
jgi:hypothetical protein